jgi:hypothetical protein
MAKHISKSVEEDIAYEIKRIGLIIHAHQTGTMSQELKDMYDEDLSDPEDAIDWLTSGIADVLSEHDPSFDYERFINQAAYKPNA